MKDRSTPLRRIRRALDLTQDEVARRAHIDRSKLSRAERAYVSLTTDELKRVSRVLHVSPGELMP